MNMEMLTNTALSKLKVHIIDQHESHDLYNGESPFIDQFYQEQGVEKYSFDTSIQIPEIKLVKGDASTDAKNAQIVYEALSGVLNRTQATDQRLWIYMTHKTCWSYMYARWGSNSRNKNPDGSLKDDTISSRYFLKRGVFRNGIARLYWAAALTYDKDNADNHYEYTEYLLSKQDILNQMDRSFTKNSDILLPALKVLKSNPELSENQIRLYFTKIRQLGGVTVLDALAPARAEKMFQEIYQQVISETFVVKNCRLVVQRERSSSNEYIIVKDRKAYLGNSLLQLSWDVLKRSRIGSILKVRKTKYKIINIIISEEN